MLLPLFRSGVFYTQKNTTSSLCVSYRVFFAFVNKVNFPFAFNTICVRYTYYNGVVTAYETSVGCFHRHRRCFCRLKKYYRFRVMPIEKHKAIQHFIFVRMRYNKASVSKRIHQVPLVMEYFFTSIHADITLKYISVFRTCTANFGRSFKSNVQLTLASV